MSYESECDKKKKREIALALDDAIKKIKKIKETVSPRGH